MSVAPKVVALTATFGRPAELSRLLRSLEKSVLPLHGLIVIDNAGTNATRDAAQSASISIQYETAGKNLGCGGGLHLAERQLAQRYPGATHAWILDDDCVIEPETLPKLLEAMASTGAAAAHPLTVDDKGRVAWFPGLLDREKFRLVRERLTPEEFLRRAGPKPVLFSWSQGIALLVSRDVLDKVGPHRTDYWVRGEDLEFTLRITQHHLGLYVPTARVAHLPPPSSSDAAHEYPKHLAMLQNLAYTAIRLPHGRPILRTLPGNWLRFHRTWGFGPRAFLASLRAFIHGAIRGRPAGAKA